MGNFPKLPYTKTPDGVQQSLFLLLHAVPCLAFLTLAVTQSLFP